MLPAHTAPVHVEIVNIVVLSNFLLPRKFHCEVAGQKNAVKDLEFSQIFVKYCGLIQRKGEFGKQHAEIARTLADGDGLTKTP